MTWGYPPGEPTRCVSLFRKMLEYHKDAPPDKLVTTLQPVLEWAFGMIEEMDQEAPK